VLFEFELQGTQWDVEEAREILTALDAAMDAKHDGQARETAIAGTP
jgi:protein involved in ribonucleotide reduction